MGPKGRPYIEDLKEKHSLIKRRQDGKVDSTRGQLWCSGGEKRKGSQES